MTRGVVAQYALTADRDASVLSVMVPVLCVAGWFPRAALPLLARAQLPPHVGDKATSVSSCELKICFVCDSVCLFCV